MLLAEAWDTPRGCPTVKGGIRLELERLRLGISTERAFELEQLIRTALATETFNTININSGLAPQAQGTRQADTYQAIGRALHLDFRLALRLLLERMPTELEKAILRNDRFWYYLLAYNNVHCDAITSSLYGEAETFVSFLRELRQQLGRGDKIEADKI